MKRLTDPAQGYCEIYCPDGIAPGCDPEKCDHKADVAMYEALKCYEHSDAAVLNRAAQIIGTAVENLREMQMYNSLIGKAVYCIRRRTPEWNGLHGRVKPHDNMIASAGALKIHPEELYVAQKICVKSDLNKLGVLVFLTREDAEAAIGGADHEHIE